MKLWIRVWGQMLACLFLLWSAASLLLGCAPSAKPNPTADSCTTIVCTNFVGLDLTRGMLNTYRENGGEGKVELILLGKDGQDMHSYEPTPADIVSVSTADILVCVGAEGWLDATVAASGNADVRRVTMMEACDTLESSENAEQHDGHAHEDTECALIGADEHVWLSVENAIRISQAIEDAICRVDVDYAAAWQASGAAHRAELTALWGEYTAMMASAVRQTVVIADRYPFAYLFRDLSLDCVAAFPGCSSETDASFATQTRLIETVRELELPYIFILEGSDGAIAATVAAQTDAEILTLHSMQAVEDREITYIQIMRQNLENLRMALQ